MSDNWELSTATHQRHGPLHGCLTFPLAWWLASKSNHPKRNRQSLYHLLWLCLETHCNYKPELFMGKGQSVQSHSRAQLFVTPRTAAHQSSLSITSSQSLLKLKSIKSVMPSNHLILCHLLLLLPSISPSIRVFSNESALYIRWPKYCSFSFSISPSNE